MNKQTTSTAAIFGLIAVISGAFGAHALKGILSITELDSWKTAVSYQFYHALAMLFIASNSRISGKYQKIIYWCFSIGILLFSGSIYLLCLDKMLGYDFSFLGPITPIGGLALIAGWFFLILAGTGKKDA